MTKRDIAIHWGVTVFVVVPVFAFCWARGAVMIARDRLTSV